jgi:hypothetical protein
VELFTYNRTLPFLPNYRTGRLVGSPCDTVSVATEEVDTGGGAVSVFPNPAQGVVTFSWQSLFNPPEGGRLILFDVSGKAVLQQQILGGSTETSIDVSTLPNGMYLYKIQFGDSVQQGKIVVAR